jgi:hypothetical protein
VSERVAVVVNPTTTINLNTPASQQQLEMNCVPSLVFFFFITASIDLTLSFAYRYGCCNEDLRPGESSSLFTFIFSRLLLISLLR